MNVIKRLRIGCEEKAIALLDWIGSRSGKPVLPAHLLTGTRGEDAALFYLRRKGYVVVARRWSPGDEPGDMKTRTAHDMTPAEAAVDDHKRTMLRRLARRYVQQLPQVAWPAVRFDVIGVYLLRAKPPEFVHFESAFDMREQSEQR